MLELPRVREWLRALGFKGSLAPRVEDLRAQARDMTRAVVFRAPVKWAADENQTKTLKHNKQKLGLDFA